MKCLIFNENRYFCVKIGKNSLYSAQYAKIAVFIIASYPSLQKTVYFHYHLLQKSRILSTHFLTLFFAYIYFYWNTVA